MSEQEEKEQEETGKKNERKYKVGSIYRRVMQTTTLRKLVRCLKKDYIVKEEKKFKDFVDIDRWPYNPNDPMDKYPYFHFRSYLEWRGHTHLKELVTWDSESEASKARRSKTAINRMKMDVRMNCPELTRVLESKEGHIRLMAGTWSAFKVSIWPVAIVWVIITALAIKYQFLHWYFLYSFINANLLALMLYSNNRIEKLFHYRRVSELFHVVQAAHFADEQKRQRNVTERATPKGKKGK
jgi:hypothetical protein